MEVELKRLEDLGDAIVNDFAYMRQREQEMRDTNGKELELAFQSKDTLKGVSFIL